MAERTENGRTENGRTDNGRTENERENAETRRRRPDLITLLFGLVTLFVASYVLTDGRVWIPMVDPRWLFTGGALLVGVLLLGSSLRGGRRKR